MRNFSKCVYLAYNLSRTKFPVSLKQISLFNPLTSRSQVQSFQLSRHFQIQASLCQNSQSPTWFLKMSDNRFCIDYAKRQAGCKKCKKKIEKGEIRIAKITASPFSDDGEMKHYHHPACIFETFKKARATTKVIEDPSDLEGWQEVEEADKQDILKLIRENERPSPTKTPEGKNAKKTVVKSPKEKKQKESTSTASESSTGTSKDDSVPSSSWKRDPINPGHKDNNFREFRRLCANIADSPSYLDKSSLVRTWVKSGTGDRFQGDLHVWVRLLLPGVIKRVYNMQNKQMVKIFSRIFNASEEEMIEDLEQGDVAETIGKFYAESSAVKPPKKSDLTIHDIDGFLDEMTKLTKEDEQQFFLKKILARCTVNDIKMFIRLMKGDLRIQAGAKHILDGVHHDAYESFNSTRNITAVIDKVIELAEKGDTTSPLSLGASLMQPVQPMLAQACKSIDMAFQKCPNGMFSEIKYDGERVQLHKKGKEFKYFSRSLKPVMPHKVKHFADHIPEAFPGGSDMILDAEVLMVDNKTGKPLPFGSLGIHKGTGFKDAVPCLFVFDIMHYNGENLMDKPIKERRKILEKQMVEVGNSIKFSELKVVTKKSHLAEMIKTVLEQGLEGLMLKDSMSTYEPGKRHWLKVKKDYLNEGAMADTADLVVLGGWYGTGNKGGLVSVWLMGCHDKMRDKWCTVTKCGNGFDDDRINKLQKELLPLMDKIKNDYSRVPPWLVINRGMVPDVLARDPKQCPVWEITGAEFSKAELHTAAGISIRFPRVTKERLDKTWATATSLDELRHLYQESKNNIDIKLEAGRESEEEDSPVKKKRKQSDRESPAKKMKVEPIVKEEPKHKFSKDDDHDHDLEADKENAETKFVLNEVSGDLFKSPKSHSLCHCVSRDFRLGKGIAKIFREKFGRIDELKSSGAGVRDIAVLRDNDRFIYNLVTKEVYSGKPTYESLRQCLEKTREHAVRNNVRNLNMPRIGCGLDGLSWPAVRTLIKNVFLRSDIIITVYTLEDTATSSNKPQTSIAEMFSKGEKSKKSPVKKKRVDIGFGYSTSQPLPDVFTEVRVYLDDGVEDAETLQRYLEAYGGEAVSEQSQATHVVYPDETSTKIENSRNSKIKHVKRRWLEDSIKLKSLQDERLYKVKQPK